MKSIYKMILDHGQIDCIWSLLLILNIYNIYKNYDSRNTSNVLWNFIYGLEIEFSSSIGFFIDKVFLLCIIMYLKNVFYTIINIAVLIGNYFVLS